MRSFGSDSPRQRAVDDDLDRGGTSTFGTKPSAQTPAISVAPMPKANAPSAPWRRRVRVGADHHLPGLHIAVLGQDLVADAAFVAADVVELRDALRGDELADLLLVRGGLRGSRPARGGRR